jgi:cytochrome b6-f complex iron-sulfur subunit
MEINEKLNRNEFLKSIGLKGAALLAVYCAGETLTSCSSGSIAPSGPVDFTIDLSTATNAALTKVSGYIIQNTTVVAQVSQDTYVAVTQICSHEGQRQVIFRNSEFYCTAHGARFTTAGKGLNSEGKNGLTVYKTQLNGTSLRVFS